MSTIPFGLSLCMDHKTISKLTIQHKDIFTVFKFNLHGNESCSQNKSCVFLVEHGMVKLGSHCSEVTR